MTKKRSLNFQYGDRELWLGVRDLLTAPVDTIVIPANQNLFLEHGLADKVSQKAGGQLQRDCQQLIDQHGMLESGMAVYTDAGQLPYKAVIHAVSPMMGEGNEQQTIELAVSRCLQLCEINEWGSVAFPAIGAGQHQVPLEIIAQALFRSIISFWDARYECALDKVMICLSEESIKPFFTAFRNEAAEPEEQNVTPPMSDDEEHIGYIELDEEETEITEDDETNNWFIK